MLATEPERPVDGVGLDAILVHCKVLDEARASLWAAVAEDEQISIESLLVREGAMSRRQLLQVLENYYFCPAIDVHAITYDARLVRMLPSRVAKRHQALVVGIQGETVCVAFARPDHEPALEAVTDVLARPFRSLGALPGDLREVIEAHYAKVAELVVQSETTFVTHLAASIEADVAPRPPAGPVDTVPGATMLPPDAAPAENAAAAPADAAPAEDTASPADAVPIEHTPASADAAQIEDTATPPQAGTVAPPPSAVRFDLEQRLAQHGVNVEPIVDDILNAAVAMHATVVHVEPAQHSVDVRFRIDGVLQRVASFPGTLTPALTSRLKALARMDEQRTPQKGRLSVQRGDATLDLRLSSLPSRFGETIVARVAENPRLLDLAELALPAEVAALHRDMIQAPDGLFLVTGPTGSGTTATLYATLAALDRQFSNVVTIEDPIEYSLPGVTQVQIDADAGLTFEAALESTLQQDPNVILVGAIRSPDTAAIACRAALAGHKVFAALCAADAARAVTQWLRLGCAPYLVAATLRGVLAQRFLRTICGSCKETYAPSTAELARLAGDATELHRGRGCEDCGFSGYRGQFPVFESFRLDERHHHMLLERPSSAALRSAARRDGMVPMATYGARAVLAGVTTVAEIDRCLVSHDA